MKISPHKLAIWLSNADTTNFATGQFNGKRWPCSFLSGRKLFIEFDPNGDLIDLSIDDGRGGQDCPANELMACLETNLKIRRNGKKLFARFAHCIRYS